LYFNIKISATFNKIIEAKLNYQKKVCNLLNDSKNPALFRNTAKSLGLSKQKSKGLTYPPLIASTNITITDNREKANDFNKSLLETHH